MISISEHLTEESQTDATTCWYNGEKNHWLEYEWDKSMGMYKYSIAGEDGYFQNGYIGTQALAKLLDKTWYSLGYL